MEFRELAIYNPVTNRRIKGFTQDDLMQWFLEDEYGLCPDSFKDFKPEKRTRDGYYKVYLYKCCVVEYSQYTRKYYYTEEKKEDSFLHLYIGKQKIASINLYKTENVSYYDVLSAKMK